jgi:predicted nucleic acid-binding Zn ribbon protein
MLCPNCKKEIAEGVQFCPDCGANLSQKPAKQKKSVTKKWWFWVLIVIVAIALISAVSGGGSDDSDTPANNDSVVQSDETTTAAETTTVKINFVPGDSVYDGKLKITYVSAEEWNGYNQYFGPKDGNKIIRLKFDFVNEGDTDTYINSFDCYADNKATESYYSGDESLPLLEMLSAGRTTSGYVYFEIPENAENIEVEYEVNAWSDKKAIFEVVL